MCQQTVWDFEDMTLEGFKVLNTPSCAGKLGYTSAVQHSGKYALGAVIKASGTTRGFQIGPPICGARGPVEAKGFTVTAWMMLAPDPSTKPPTLGRNAYFGIRITTESGDTLVKGAFRGYNEWFPVSVNAPAGDTQLKQFVLEGVFASDIVLPEDWVGDIFFDDITIN
jgi:hypothetical protein